MRNNLNERLKDHSGLSDDQPMYQYFGQEVSKESEASSTKQKIGETVVKVFDSDHIEKVGFWAMIGVLLILLISFVVKMNVSGSIVSITMISLFFFGVRKLTISHDANTNYYLANVTTTLKAMFRYFPKTAKLLPYAHKILNISVMSMMVEHFILRWFLFPPLSSLIYTIGFYGMWIGLILCFAKRETGRAYRGFALAYLYYLITIISSGLFNNEIYIFTVISAFVVWSITILMKKCVIEDIQVTER